MDNLKVIRNPQSEEVIFEKWIKDIGCVYKNLTDLQKIQTLDYLIGLSEAAQLHHLSEELGSFLKRDFLKLLPTEVKFHLLEFLDVESILTCCQVSQQWNSVVNSCSNTWRRACAQVGVALHKYDKTGLCLEAWEYKQLYLQARASLHDLRMGRSCEQMVLWGHSDRIMAVCYHDGKLATGSDDRTVRIWDCETGICLRTLSTHSVADVKFDSTMVVTGSFDTTASSWDLHSGHLIQEFRGHAATVFSVDYDTELDVLVTGSADSCVILWSLSEGIMHRVLPSSNAAWIIQVKLSRTECDNNYYVLSRDNVSIMVWKIDHHSNQTIVCSNKELQHPDNELLPGLQLLGSSVHFACMDTFGFLCHLCQSDLGDPGIQICVAYEVPRGAYVKAYLGSGATFHALLLDGETMQPTLNLIHFKTGKLIASLPLPSKYRESKRGSTFTLGGMSWLDGFDGEHVKGTLFASSQMDNSICLLKWKKMKHKDKLLQEDM